MQQMTLQTLTFLIAAFSAAQASTDTKRSDLNVTLGSVAQTKSGYLTVLGPSERGQRKSGAHQDATLQFRYRGPSKKTSKLASGGFIRQIGLKMRTKDTCNLLYVMWRIAPTEEIVVLIKSNPGKSTHADCGAGGYVSVATVPLDKIGVTATSNETHSLRTRILKKADQFTCSVLVDDKEVWSGPLDAKIIAPINGPVGFRTDNGSFIFKLFVR